MLAKTALEAQNPFSGFRRLVFQTKIGFQGFFNNVGKAFVPLMRGPF
jgi:hypothetical protein